MTDTLKQKAVKGVLWSLTENFGLQGMKFVLGILLARLLTPKEFGLIAMVMVIFTIAEVFIQSGFGQSYVQKKQVTNTDANTIFFYNLFVSTILYSIVFISAPSIAVFYNQPELVLLIRVMGFVLIINSFNIIQVAKINREVDFKRKTKITLTATLISGTFGIAAALYGLGVWSLVIQILSNRIFITIGLWITSKWMPSFDVSAQSFKDMFSFGFWVLLSSILRKLFDNIYILTIGKFFPIFQVGLYDKAKQFSEIASNQIASTISVISFPIFSRLQDDIVELKENVRDFLKYTLLIIIPILTIILLFAEPIVILLLTDKWAEMIPYLQVMCIVGMIYPIKLINYQVILALGKGRLSFFLAMVTNVLRLLNIIIIYRFGVLYILIGEVILTFVSYFINTIFTSKYINYSFINQINDIINILIAALFSGLLSFYMANKFSDLYLVLLLGSFLTLTTYIILNYIFNKVLLIRIYRQLKTLITKDI